MNLNLPEPSISIAALVGAVEDLLVEARKVSDDFRAVNWGDLGVCNVEYIIPLLRDYEHPGYVVTIEEAGPDCGLSAWIGERLDPKKFPHVYIECEW